MNVLLFNYAKCSGSGPAFIQYHIYDNMDFFQLSMTLFIHSHWLYKILFFFYQQLLKLSFNLNMETRIFTISPVALSARAQLGMSILRP